MAAWRSSGLSQAAFCEQRGLSPSTIGKWRRRLVHERSEALVPVKRPEFVAVDIPVQTRPLVRVSLGAVTVDFETVPPPAWIAELADEVSEEYEYVPHTSSVASIGAGPKSVCADASRSAMALSAWQKYRCDGSDCQHIETALEPDVAKPVKNGRYTLNFAVQVLIDKYALHLPLDRQSRMMRDYFTAALARVVENPGATYTPAMYLADLNISPAAPQPAPNNADPSRWSGEHVPFECDGISPASRGKELNAFPMSPSLGTRMATVAEFHRRPRPAPRRGDTMADSFYDILHQMRSHLAAAVGNLQWLREGARQEGRNSSEIAAIADIAESLELLASDIWRLASLLYHPSQQRNSQNQSYLEGGGIPELAAAIRKKSGSTCLTIEDDEAQRRHVVQALEAHGFEVASVGDFDAAAAVLREFDLVICDLELGGAYGGLDVLAALRKMSSSAVMVVHSAHCWPHVVSEAMRRGADGFVAKPAHPDRIIVELARALNILPQSALEFETFSLDLAIERHAARVYEEHGENKSQSAEALGISRSRLDRLLTRVGSRISQSKYETPKNQQE